jgi:hypothetical protein
MVFHSTAIAGLGSRNRSRNIAPQIRVIGRSIRMSLWIHSKKTPFLMSG